MQVTKPTRGTFASDLPLCVDLDGSLVRTDILIESLLGLVKERPWLLVKIPGWLLKGKAYLKERIAHLVDLDVRTLPYDTRVLAMLSAEHARGRTLVLATATHRKYADQVAEHLGFFDEVIATQGNTNVSAGTKGQALVSRFGEGGFDYLGNDRADLPVWRRARQAVVANPRAGLVERARLVADVAHVLDRPRPAIRSYVKALRLHQWLKNVLVFVPLLTAHRVADLTGITASAVAYVAFGLVASSVYVLNDLMDLEADRHHVRKRHRPFAAGTVPLVHGIFLVPTLFLAGALLCAWLPPLFGMTLLGYYSVTLAYTFRLKQLVLVDVIVLAALYTLRILAGAAAINVLPSFWLLAFSVFIFLSLALVKRYSELLVMRHGGKEVAKGRGYEFGDLSVLVSLGAASGYMAVLVAALYINSSDVLKLYRRPEALWMLCPLILFWISRVWLLAHRGKMHDDPVIFAVRDRWSRWIAVLGAIAILLAV